MSAVDVVVPCYNYARYLSGCVRSVLSQSGVTVRVLVIDDQSSDNTAQIGQELASSDGRVEFRRHAVNHGHIATFNEGIEWASADYMLILSADDYLLPGALGRAVRLMDEHPEIGFAFGEAIEVVNDSTSSLENVTEGESWRVLTGLEFIERSGSHNIVPTPTAVTRTKLQKQVGGYRPELPHAGDMEMWLRMAAHASVGIVDSPQAVYRRHKCNMSLAYHRTEGSLPDLEQRRVALDFFFQTCNPLIPNADQLRSRLFRMLSYDAIGMASRALNEGEFAVSRRLTDFAVQLSPHIKKSYPWLKLACKRQLPETAWRTMRLAVSDIRHVASSLKRLASSVTTNHHSKSLHPSRGVVKDNDA